MTQEQEDQVSPKSGSSNGDGKTDMWAVMEREMNTRDTDADVYETAFFTGFQDQAEQTAYTEGFKGQVSKLGLENGCATGRMFPAMTSETIFGLDLSRASLMIALERYGSSVPLFQASSTHLPFRDGAFDQVLCSGVMLHLPDEASRRLALQEMNRVITRPAKLVIATHGYPWLVKRRYPKHRVHHELSWYRHDADELEGMIRETLSPCTVHVRAICNIPRWRIGNRLGTWGVRIDSALSRIPGLKYLTGTLLVADVDCRPR